MIKKIPVIITKKFTNQNSLFESKFVTGDTQKLLICEEWIKKLFDSETILSMINNCRTLVLTDKNPKKKGVNSIIIRNDHVEIKKSRIDIKQTTMYDRLMTVCRSLYRKGYGNKTLYFYIR